jgi:hypothetical protein
MQNLQNEINQMIGEIMVNNRAMTVRIRELEAEALFLKAELASLKPPPEPPAT